MSKRPIEEIEAGDAFVHSLVPHADRKEWAPLWHGWAIMDGFLAGIDFARSKGAPDSIRTAVEQEIVAWLRGDNGLTIPNISQALDASPQTWLALTADAIASGKYRREG